MVVSKGCIHAFVSVVEECEDIEVVNLEACICAMRNLGATDKIDPHCVSKQKAKTAVVGALNETIEKSYENMNLVQKQW